MEIKCYIKEVDQQEKINFLQDNHIQGNVNSKINVGLYYNKRMVSLICFTKSRFNKNFKWELQRFCNQKFFNVVGGFSKLLKYFVNLYGRSIITYADRRYSNGKLYESNSFKKIYENPPSYKYTNGMVVINRMQAQKYKLPKLIQNYNEDLTEYQNMFMNGWDKIGDCGNLVYKIENM